MDGPTFDLPNSDSMDIELVHPTEDEKVSQWISNGSSWKGALSSDVYLRRERYLAKQNLTKSGGITYWFLVDTSKQPRLVLCGCETIRKRALVAQAGTLEDAISHGIGSVFCPSAMRRRGYAARMLKELGQKIHKWQTGVRPCWFTVLYSDIGKNFYSALGWEAFHSFHLSIPAAPGLSESDVEKLPPSRPLSAPDIAELCVIDETLIRQRMTLERPQQRVTVALIPDLHTIQWHHAREEFIGRELYGRIPDIKGAIVGEKGSRIWCYWTRNWQNKSIEQSEGNKLHILRIVAERGGLAKVDIGIRDQDIKATLMTQSRAITSLFMAAQLEARKWNIVEIESWNPTEAVVLAARRLSQHATVVQRDKDSIPSLRWHGDSPELDDAPLMDQVDWIVNEKCGWC